MEFLVSLVTYLIEKPGAAVLLSVAVAVATTILTIKSQRKLARQRATIDVLMRNLWDKDYMKSQAVTYGLLSNSKELEELYEQTVVVRQLKREGRWDSVGYNERRRYEAATEQMQHVQAILNDRELMAIGVRQGAVDDAIYRRWWFSTLLHEWDAAEATILRIRRDFGHTAGNAMFSEFEQLTKRWRSEGRWERKDRYVPLPGGRMYRISRYR